MTEFNRRKHDRTNANGTTFKVSEHQVIRESFIQVPNEKDNTDSVYGGKYVGEWKNSKKQGQGVFTWENGSKYIGEFNNDKRSGQGTYTRANGDKYVGEFNKGLFDGHGAFTSFNGIEYIGNFKNGVRSGQGTLISVGGIEYVGQFKDNEPNGYGTKSWANGCKYVGQFKDGLRNGEGTFTELDGSSYKGEWVDDKCISNKFFLKKGQNLGEVTSHVDKDDHSSEVFDTEITRDSSTFKENTSRKSRETTKANSEIVNNRFLEWPNIKVNDQQWIAIVKTLVEQGNDINVKNGKGDTLLNEIVIHSQDCTLRKINALIDLKSDVNTQDVWGNTPLHRSIYSTDLKIIRLLLNSGANVNALNDARETPLHQAARLPSFENVKLLVKFGAQVNALNNSRETPLHQAARFGTAENLQALLDSGANANVYCKAKKTPWDFAKRNKTLIGTAAYKALEFESVAIKEDVSKSEQIDKNTFKIYTDGSTYLGEFKNGFRNGQGTFTWLSGDKYVGEWKDEKTHGQGTLTYSNGDEYVGEWEHDEKHGEGTYHYIDGDQYAGEFRNDKMHGQGIFTEADGGSYTGEWIDDYYIGQKTSLKSYQRVDDEKLVTDKDDQSAITFDTRTVGDLSKLKENTSSENRDTIQPKAVKKMSDFKVSNTAELNEKAELLESFLKASDIIEYSELAKIAWTAIQVLPAEYEEQFLSKLDNRPEVHPDTIALEVYKDFLKERPVVETTEAKNAAISVRAISLKAEDEFARIVGYKNETISLDNITLKITTKFGEQDNHRAEAFTYFEKLKSEDEVEWEFSEKERITQELIEKEKLEHYRLAQDEKKKDERRKKEEYERSLNKNPFWFFK